MKLFPRPTVDDNETRYCFILPRTETPDDALPLAQAQCAAFLSFAAEQTRDFLWHKHAFDLQVVATRDGRYILSGHSQHGDAMQDEWVLAKLVFDITKHFSPVVGRIIDSDGEFLLIESAHVLPDWVTPETSEGRVFVVNGKLHLAPPETTSTQKSKGKKSVFYDPHAFDQVINPTVETEASFSVQQAVQAKLDQVPTYLRTNRHRVKCLLPEKVAHIVTSTPQLVAPAVEAFYYREPLETSRVCTKMAKFLSPGDKIVETRVSFSKAMFAQLKCQVFYPPTVFLTRDARFQVLETRNVEEKNHDEKPRNVQAMELGMKLACGFELLYAGNGVNQRGRAWHHVLDEIVRPCPDPILVSSSVEEPDDDESWLYLEPETLESKLQRMASMEPTRGGANELESIATLVDKFVDGESGVDGVEGTERVQFDLTAFMDILQGPLSSSESERESDSDSIEDDEKLGLDETMAAMDVEVAQTRRIETDRGKGQGDDDPRDTKIGSEKPLELEFQVLSNLLESVAAQDGQAGPVSTILHELNSFATITP